MQLFLKGSAMAKRSPAIWNNKMISPPRIEGNLEVSKRKTDIFIGGDPEGLRSFARLLMWLADIDQELLSSQPDGERCHVHLHTKDAEGFNSLTPFSSETEVCRLDAKGTGEFPKEYRRLGKGTPIGAKGSGKRVNNKEAKQPRGKGKVVAKKRSVKARKSRSTKA